MGITKPKNKALFFSPLRYPGGKTCLAPKLDEAMQKYFPHNKNIIFVEPYAGGAGASLSLLFSNKVDKIIINDRDRAIFTFWKVAVQNTNYLIRKIKQTKITIAEWHKQKSIYTQREKLLHNLPGKTPQQTNILSKKAQARSIYISSQNEKKLAFATLFLNRTNRSGIMRGGPIGGMTQSGKWKIDERFTKKTIIERLQKIHKFKDKIKVLDWDGIKLLRKLEKKKNKDRYFIFLDPPYFQKGRSLYLNNYGNQEHEELSNFLINSSLGKWLMTYNDTNYIKDLYKKMTKIKFKIQHDAYRSAVGREIMIFPK